jgi:hypothetical protein
MDKLRFPPCLRPAGRDYAQAGIRFSPESPPDLGKNPWESEALKFSFESSLTFKDNLIK